jgi:general secretion pathway protein A
LAALERGPFYGLLTGPSGSGKTSLKDDIAAALDPHRHLLLYLSATANASSVGLARFLAQTFRVTPRRSFLETVTEVVAALKAHPTAIALWLDEADQLSHETLAELRGLAESDGKGRPIFSVVLSGLPELRTILDTPSLFPLKRRLDRRCVLEGLRRDELAAFLAHGFGSAGAARVPEHLHDEIFERTQATPALVRKLVAHILELAGDGHEAREEHCHGGLEALGLCESRALPRQSRGEHRCPPARCALARRTALDIRERRPDRGEPQAG